VGEWAGPTLALIGACFEVFYNRVRRHSSIGMQSPMRFEKLHQQLTTAA
jgi:transposase InsO family protein